MSDTTLSVPKDVLEPIIQAHIAAAVATALGNRTEILERAVAQVLNQKVDSSGKPTTSSYDSTSWIQLVMRQAIQKATKEAIETAMVEHRAVIKKTIVEQLSTKNSPLMKQLVLALTGALTNPETLKYRLSVDCVTE